LGVPQKGKAGRKTQHKMMGWKRQTRKNPRPTVTAEQSQKKLMPKT